MVITSTVRQDMFPASGGNSPGLRNGVIHAPVASEIPLAAYSKGLCRLPSKLRLILGMYSQKRSRRYSFLSFLSSSDRSLNCRGSTSAGDCVMRSIARLFFEIGRAHV